MRAAYLCVALLLALPAAADERVLENIAPPDADAASLGEPVSIESLDSQRGGDEDIVTNVIHVTGEVTDNAATNVVTGHNSINEGSFANSSGLTTVVQNTGANVLIQNATIVNVQFVDP